MKILLATQDYPPVEGGMARYYADLAGGFPPGEIVVSTTRGMGAGEVDAPAVDIRRERFPMSEAHRFLALRSWSRSLERLVRSERPDAIVCGNVRPLGPVISSLAGRAGIPYAVIVHGNDLLAARRRWSGWRSGLWKRVFGGAAHWIANSHAVRRIGVDLGLDPARSAVVHPEVDTGRFRPPAAGQKAAIRERLGILQDELLVLFVGRFVERKGLDRLLEALAVMTQPWRLLAAGFGDSAPFRSLAASLNIEHRILWKPGVPEADLPDLYRAADLAAMPSRTIGDRDLEGFGIVFLEAAASGLPVIAGRSGGVAEAVEDGVTGILVDGNDRSSIEAALLRLSEENTLREALGRNGRQRVVSRFGKGSSAAELREVLVKSNS